MTSMMTLCNAAKNTERASGDGELQHVCTKAEHLVDVDRPATYHTCGTCRYVWAEPESKDLRSQMETK